MLTGIPVVLAMLAQVSVAPQPSTGAKTPSVASASNACPAPASESQTIVICAERPQGYRIDPDVLEAKREKKNPGRPVRPGGTVIPDCAHVGPAPCTTAGVNLLSAAATAAEMGRRLSAGQEVGSMFQTDPHLSEYELYERAKARREEAEAEKAAKKAKAEAEAKEAAQRSGN